MVGFYQDSRRKALFHESFKRFGPCNQPATCEVDVLEWSPGKMVTQFRTIVCPMLSAFLGDLAGTGNLIRTNAHALPSRVQPRVQIV